MWTITHLKHETYLTVKCVEDCQPSFYIEKTFFVYNKKL